MEHSFIFISSQNDPIRVGFVRTFEVIMQVEWLGHAPLCNEYKIFCTSTNNEFQLSEFNENDVFHLKMEMDEEMNLLDEPDSGAEPEDIPGNDR